MCEGTHRQQCNIRAKEPEHDDEYGLFAKDEGLSVKDKEHIEGLYTQAGNDRSKAYELKRELDRLGVFPEYENRFLDLFKKRE